MFSKLTNGLVNNRSIKSKLLMGLVLMALLPIVTLVLSGYGFTQYRNVVDSEHRADGLNTLLKQEGRSMLLRGHGVTECCQVQPSHMMSQRLRPVFFGSRC